MNFEDLFSIQNNCNNSQDINTAQSYITNTCLWAEWRVKCVTKTSNARQSETPCRVPGKWREGTYREIELAIIYEVLYNELAYM